MLQLARISIVVLCVAVASVGCGGSEEDYGPFAIAAYTGNAWDPVDVNAYQETPAPERSRWVSADGSDSNNGKTPQTPWQTFGKAMGESQTWDLLQVLPSSKPLQAYVELYEKDSGEQGSHNIIRGVDSDGKLAPPGSRPLITPIRGPAPFVIASRYWLFEGLEMDCRSMDRVTGFFLLSGKDGQASNVTIRHSTVRGCQNSAIQVSAAKDIVIGGNELLDNIYQPKEGEEDVGDFDSNGVMIINGSERVLIHGNRAEGNSDDGVQCEGGGGPIRDLVIEQNILNHNGEEAVDVKACDNVDIVDNEMAHYAKSSEEGDCGGSAIILHNSPQRAATRVLIAGNNIQDSGIGINVGKRPYKPSDPDFEPIDWVVVRRNTIHHINEDRMNCGDGLLVQNAKRLFVYNNTFDQIAHSGMAVDISESDRAYVRADSVSIFNNIFSYVLGETNGGDKGGVLDLTVLDRMSNFDSNHNLFYPPHLARFKSNRSILRYDGGITWSDQLVTDKDSTDDHDPAFLGGSGREAYRLTIKSGAIDTGARNSITKREAFCGNDPDKGALEYRYEC